MINSLNDAVIDTVLNATPSTTRTAGGKEIPYPFPSPADWRDHWIYFLLVDRFDNPSAPPRSADPCDTYQGGSLADIKRRLPYLSELAAHFDYRLRLLTTEMRRILAEERMLRLRLGRNAALGEGRLQRLLQWV